MTRILVTGGTGALGQDVVAKLRSTQHRIRLLSRKPPPAIHDPTVEWMQGDVVNGSNLASVLSEVDIVVNCVGDAQNAYETDVLGVKRLAVTAQQTGVRHFFHISIVGIERMDVQFYRYKLEAEKAVAASRVPYSIQRVTQFHSLLDHIMSQVKILPKAVELSVAQDACFQLIDTRDVAQYILPLLLAEPAGHLPDVGGPEILRMDEIAKVFLHAHGIIDPILVDAPEGFFSPNAVEAFRQGIHTVPDRRYGQVTWADYVREKYQQS